MVVYKYIMNRDTMIKILLNYWDKSTNDVNVDYYAREWFHSKNSFRLTEKGFDFLYKDLDITPQEVAFPDSTVITPQIIIFLERHLTMPYFLTRDSIFVFDERVYFELTMLSNDIKKYGLLNALSSRNN